MTFVVWGNPNEGASLILQKYDAGMDSGWPLFVAQCCARRGHLWRHWIRWPGSGRYARRCHTSRDSHRTLDCVCHRNDRGSGDQSASESATSLINDSRMACRQIHGNPRRNSIHTRPRVSGLTARSGNRRASKSLAKESIRQNALAAASKITAPRRKTVWARGLCRKLPGYRLCGGGRRSKKS